MKIKSLLVLSLFFAININSVSLSQSSTLCLNGSAYIKVSDNAGLILTNSMTIEAWIYLDDNANNTIIYTGDYNYLFVTYPNGQHALGLYSKRNYCNQHAR
jgi:hypothetical protein